MGWNEVIQVIRMRHTFLPTAAWELNASKAAGIQVDLLRFALSFFLAVALAPGIRLFSSPRARNAYSLIVGCLLVYYPFGNGALHALPPALLTYIFISVAPKHCGYLAWLINFPYLLALHSVNASGSKWNKGELDFTGAQMVMVLKLISLAMARQDAMTKKPEEMNEYQKSKAIQKVPGLIEYLGYVFALGNLLSGPTFELVDYLDFIHLRGDYAVDPNHPPASCVVPGFLCLARSVACLLVYMVLYPKINFNLFFTDYYRSKPLHIRLLLQYIVATVYRYKYYFGWGLSETALVFAGFSHTKAEAGSKWDKYCNAYLLSLEVTDSFRKIPIFWNVHTGIFLRRYVYDRLTPRSGRPNFTTLAATQFVSGIWHGLYPGYMLFFISSAIAMHASTCLHKWEATLLAPVAKTWVWHVVKVVYNCMVLNYLAASFMILALMPSLEVWGSVYFIPHILMFAIILAHSFFPGRKPKPAAKAE